MDRNIEIMNNKLNQNGCPRVLNYYQKNLRFLYNILFLNLFRNISLKQHQNIELLICIVNLLCDATIIISLQDRKHK